MLKKDLEQRESNKKPAKTMLHNDDDNDSTES